MDKVLEDQSVVSLLREIADSGTEAGSYKGKLFSRNKSELVELKFSNSIVLRRKLS